MRFKRYRGALAAALTVLSTLPAAQAAAKLKVVTTTSDLRSLVESIGGDKVDAASMGTGREDPHFIDAKPSCMVLARDADLWVCVGMELEIGYENLVIDGSHNPKIRRDTPGYLDCSQGVLRLEVPTGKIDRSMGDIHPMGNPHYCLDPLNVRIVAKSIAAKLVELDSSDAAYFNTRLKEFTTKLDTAMFGGKLLEAAGKAAGNPDQAGAKLWALLLKDQLDAFVKDHGGDGVRGGWWGTLRPLQGTKIITYHRSWPYFAKRFGLDVVAELEPKPGIEPTPSHLNDVIQIIEQQKVKFLLIEPFYSRKAPDWLAEKTGVKVVVVASLVGGQPEATDYIAMIDHIVQKCAEACAASSSSEGK